MRQERRLYLSGVFFLLLSIGTILAFPLVIRIIVDEGILGERYEILTPLALLLGGLLTVESLSISRLYLAFGRAARKNVEALRLQLAEHLVEQEIAFFDRENSGELMARLMVDIGEVNVLLSQSLPMAIRQAFFLVAGAALVIYTSPLLAVAIAMIWPVTAYGTSKLGNRAREAGRELQQSESRLAQAALETLGGIRTVRAYAREKFEMNRFRGFTDSSIQSAQKGIKAHARLMGFSRFSGEAAVVGGIWLGGKLIVGDYLTPGALISFILYAGIVAQATRVLSSSVAIALRVHGSTERIFSYLDRETRMPLDGGLEPERTVGKLDFEDVIFHYEEKGTDDHPHGVEGLNLTIEHGEEIAIVGASGSGKSTIVQLATRFYDPDEGVIRLDGIDLRELNPGWLRSHVTYVSQDASLFGRTLDENLRYGNAEASQEDVMAAVQAAGATGLIASQPDGYQTQVGERGARLSGGQCQRVALARALIREPEILILDEATSALDSESEAGIKESLRKLPLRPTVVWIAHRLATVVDVARVLVVDRGQIIADGSHAELMQNSATYRELVETQLVSE